MMIFYLLISTKLSQSYKRLNLKINVFKLKIQNSWIIVSLLPFFIFILHKAFSCCVKLTTYLVLNISLFFHFIFLFIIGFLFYYIYLCLLLLSKWNSLKNSPSRPILKISDREFVSSMHSYFLRCIRFSCVWIISTKPNNNARNHYDDDN